LRSWDKIVWPTRWSLSPRFCCAPASIAACYGRRDVSDWNAELYRRFEAERTRPAIDLLARVAAERPALVVDLGCGPGNSTELLARLFPAAELIGIDTSPAMLQAARARLPAASFEMADVASWAPGRPPDVLCANATLQWVPDHPRLYPRLMALLAPGGWLATQVPDNLEEPSHTAMREVALAGGFPDVVTAAESERTRIGSFEDHWAWLAPSAASVDLWRTTYVHPLAGPDAVVEWLRATGLRPYLSRLPQAAHADFLAAYRDAIARAYPPRPDGTVLLRFPRLFAVAQRR
jgi:trans-aconitate 2-methyltransferase